ncbi:hypothetical protein C8J57DRAFT_1467063 [Mycena rebaudengoi]|nr:hypothetical protein C8J57DRAFT_1467063 [Mycena rebaudengoi]
MVRYTVLGLVTALAVICAVHFKLPSTQLDLLVNGIQNTEDIIHGAKLECVRDQVGLTEAGIRLLEIKRLASMIRCRILETSTVTWNKFRQLSQDIAECEIDVKKICTAVQAGSFSSNKYSELTVEAERQRKYTEHINETQTVLTAVRDPIVFRYNAEHSYLNREQHYRLWRSEFLTCAQPVQKSEIDIDFVAEKLKFRIVRLLSFFVVSNEIGAKLNKDEDKINGPSGNLGSSIAASAAGKPNIYLGLPYLGM